MAAQQTLAHPMQPRPSSSTATPVASPSTAPAGSDSDVPDHSPPHLWAPHAWFQLSFADTDLEATFTQHNNAVLARWDEIFCSIHLGSLLFFLVALELGWLGSTPDGRYWTAVTTMVVGCQFLIYHIARSSTLTTHRFGFIMSFRLLVTLTAPMYVRQFYPVTTGLPHFIVDIFITSCGPMGMWQGLGMPVLYRHHILIQLLAISVYGYLANTSVCHRFAASATTQDTLSYVWSRLDHLFTTIADIYFPFYQRRARKQLPACLCLPVVVMMQFVVGYIAPTCTLYYMECSTRVGFLRTRAGSRHRVTLPNEGLIPDWIGKLLGMSLVGFACTTVWLLADSYVAAASKGEC